MFSNAGDLPPAKNPDERRVIIETASKQTSDLNNPCMKEQKMSYQCLSENNYDKEKCSAVFANYVACQKFWKQVQDYRRVNGIRPNLPRPEDREKVKQEFIEKLNLRNRLPNSPRGQ